MRVKSPNCTSTLKFDHWHHWPWNHLIIIYFASFYCLLAYLIKNTQNISEGNIKKHLMGTIFSLYVLSLWVNLSKTKVNTCRNLIKPLKVHVFTVTMTLGTPWNNVFISPKNVIWNFTPVVYLQSTCRQFTGLFFILKSKNHNFPICIWE